MPWYYAEGALQNGPVTDDEFADLVRNGKVRGGTLVWREGMANWQPYSIVAPQAAGAPPAVAAPVASTQVAPNEIVCQECGKAVPKENAIQYGTVWVCGNCKPLFLQKLREGAAPIARMPYAGFWIRFIAEFIDGFIIGVVFFVPIIFLMMGRSGGTTDLMSLMFNPFLNLGSTAVLTVYNTLFIGKFGASPGKMIFGMRVITSDGGRVSYARALGRSLAEILSSLICYIGYIIAAFDDQKRALHDHICDTRVVRK